MKAVLDGRDYGNPSGDGLRDPGALAQLVVDVQGVSFGTVLRAGGLCMIQKRIRGTPNGVKLYLLHTHGESNQF